MFADCSIRNARSLNSINRAKCSITFSASGAGIKKGVLEINWFQEVQLPIKDFGLPLISSRIKYSDSIPLLEKCFKRIGRRGFFRRQAASIGAEVTQDIESAMLIISGP